MNNYCTKQMKLPNRLHRLTGYTIEHIEQGSVRRVDPPNVAKDVTTSRQFGLKDGPHVRMR